MTRFLVGACVAMAVATSVNAQKQDPQRGMPGGGPDMMKLQTAMADAQKQASHPGDSNMTCDQLEAEAVAQMQQPTVRAQVAVGGESAETMKDNMDKVQGAAKAAAAVGLATSIMTGVMSTVPGLGMIAGRASQAAQQAAQARAQAVGQAANASNQVEIAKSLDSLTAIMPNLMRTHHMLELGQAKKCEFAKNAGNTGMPNAGGGRGR